MGNADRRPGTRSRSIRVLAPRMLLAFVLAVLVSCSALPRHPRPDDFEDVGSGFSGQLVNAHIDALRGLSVRFSGHELEELTRAYLARAFDLAGAQTRSLGEGDDERHLVAEFEGASSDVVLVAAVLPTAGSASRGGDEGGAQDHAGDLQGAEGAAVLVELARVFGTAKPSHTFHLALAEIGPAPSIETRVDREEAEMGETMRSGRNALGAAADARRRLSAAGRQLAADIAREGGTQRIRGIVTLDLSGLPSPRFLRDLESHPEFRKIFWDNAARLGETTMFPPEADWQAVDSLHLGFRERSMDRVLALVDGGSAPGDVASAAPRAVADRIRGFQALGSVMVESLDQMMIRFAKVDAFTR